MSISKKFCWDILYVELTIAYLFVQSFLEKTDVHGKIIIVWFGNQKLGAGFSDDFGKLWGQVVGVWAGQRCISFCQIWIMHWCKWLDRRLKDVF